MRRSVAAILLTVSVLMPLGATGADTPVPIYIVQPRAELVDAAMQSRIDSTKDLREIKWDKKLVRLVESPADAVIIIEVINRATGTLDERKVTRDIVTGQVKSEAKGAKSVVVKLTFGEYSTEIIGSDEEGQIGMPPTWTGAAIDARSKVQKWVKTNRAKLPTQ